MIYRSTAPDPEDFWDFDTVEMQTLIISTG